MNNRKQTLAMAVSGLVIASLVFTGATTAIWKDGTNLSGQTITAGNLDLETIDSMSWVDSKNNNQPINLNSYKIVPGDEIVGTQSLDVAMEGDNIMGVFSVHSREQNTGALLGDHDGLTVSYTVENSAGKQVVSETPWGVSSSIVNVTQQDVSKTIDKKVDYKVKVRAVFDANTPEQVRTQTIAKLGAASVNFKQVRSFSDSQLSMNSAVSIATPTGGTTDEVRVGDTVLYSFTVTNTGSTNISGVTINNPALTQKNISFASVDLAPGQSYTFKASYKPTVKDLLAGKISSNAAAEGTAPNNTLVRTDFNNMSVKTAEPMVILDLQQKYEFVKDNGTYGSADPGDIIKFTWTVKNIGGIPAKDIKIDSSWIRNQYSLTTPAQIDSLAPGETATFTAQASPTIDDLVTKSITNTATAYGLPGTCGVNDSCVPAISNSQTIIIPAVYMRVLVADTFNRKNGPAGNTSIGGVPWSAIDGEMKVIDGKFKKNTDVPVKVSTTSKAVVETGVSDVDIQVKFNNHYQWSENGVIFRAKDSKNYLDVKVMHTGVVLRKIENGVASEIGTAQVSIAETSQRPYILRVVSQGDAIIVEYDGATVINALSSSYQSETKHGLSLSANNADDFYVTDTIRGVSAVTADDFTRTKDGRLGTTSIGNAVWRSSGYFDTANGKAVSNFWVDEKKEIKSWDTKSSVETLLRDADVSVKTYGINGVRGLIIKADGGIKSGHAVYLSDDNNINIDRISPNWISTLKTIPVNNTKGMNEIKVETRGSTANVYLDGIYLYSFTIDAASVSSTHYGIYVNAVEKTSGPHVSLDDFKVTKVQK